MQPRATSILLTALACAVVGHAQTSTTSGAIRGMVKSRQGTPVKGASLVVRNSETGFSRTAVANDRGEYQFVFLPVGTYDLTVTAPGLRTGRTTGLRVSLGQTTDMNFALDSAEAAAVVEVVAQSEGLDTTQINTQTSITPELVEAIPVNGRNFTDLVQLTPGAAVGGTSYYTSVEGARGVQNNLQIDGASFNSKFNTEQRGGTRIPFTFGQDSIKELQVITNSFDAQYGDAVGAVINAVTKTGTNEPSGMAFILFRPNSLVAKVKPVPYDPKGTVNDPDVRTRNFHSTQAGFNFGGPIIKDRLHYFINVEAARTSEDSVPAFGFNDAYTGNTTADYNAFFGPSGMGTLMTTMPGRTLAQENKSAWTDRQTNLTVMGRLDWTINTNHRAAFRLNSQTYEGLNDIYPGTRRSDTAESGNSTMKFSSLSTVLELNSILSTNLINEARLQIANEKRPTTPNTTLSAPVRIARIDTSYAINAGQYYIDPRNTEERTTQFQDNLTFFSGDWTLKAGTDLQKVSMKNRYLPNSQGSWTFTSYDAANQWFAGNTNGTGVTYSQGFSPLDGVSDFDLGFLAGYAQAQYGGFFSNRLLLSLGARYTVERWSGNPNPNPKLQGLDQAPNDSSLDPRFGFSFDLSGNGRTVVRGGYGWFSVGNPGQTVSGAMMNNGINLVSYYVSSSSAANLPLFQSGGVLSAGSRWSGPLTGPGALTAVPLDQLATLPKDSITVTLMDPEAKMAQARTASLALEHDFGNGYTGAIRATYKQFRNLQYAVNINLAQYADGSTTALSGAIYNDGYASTWNRFSNASANRPYSAIVRGRLLDLSGFGDVILSKYDGEGRYKSLVVEGAKRTKNGWGFRGNVTFSKAEDNNSNDRATLTSTNALTENPADPLGSYALSDNDHKFRAVLAWYAPAVYGIQVSGITTYTSGRPFNGVYYDDLNGDGKYLDTANGRNTFRQPGSKTFDLRVSRYFNVNRKVSLQGIVDVFNVFNWANQYTSQTTWSKNPSTYPDNYSAIFGAIDRPDNRTREVQFTLKVRF
ncbi:cell envelope biogenesis protein OmpA [Geothrix rubra]|uniref:Cell envelope biogenesis protein OmpA n=1 Tax=Geothrix rubra TaxID=2927977 RepID=A0ABQ5Q1T1_9BACT|nr:carboxypeptidase regulatory-like domain-containing protein [Geothrix rubra]GLH68692.1 cell envelope biogenesis protein OmpA [Geothrix rubra]